MSDILKNTRCFLFDMDGTIFLGNRLLSGAVELTSYLRASGIPYYFLTNNSSRSREDYVQKLENLGLSTPLESIFSSGQATALYLQKQKPGASIYLVGTPSLEEEFCRSGFNLVESDPDFVVLGFDTTLTYEKLRKLCAFVRDGRPYFATHPDINCPTEDGFIPDTGAMIALVEASTGRRPDVVIGKPNRPIIDAITAKTGFSAPEITMVGDRLYTDIAMGQHGLATVLVLSGETSREDIPVSTYKPDLVILDIAELNRLLREL
ncbi:MAG: HAD-IIA family hydrolase [Anaerolineales bacterium]|nr:HAD-IIA family hydrolase [Anaerolineales bacterium]